MPSELEYKRAIKVIEDSLLADTGQKVRSIEARDSFGNITTLYDRKKGEITGTLQTEKGENNSAKLENAIEVINQSGEVDVVCLDNDQTALTRAICLLGIGIFIGLMLAGVIYSLTP